MICGALITLAPLVSRRGPAADGQAIISPISVPSLGDSGKTDAVKQRETLMSYVLSNIPCKEQDRRGIICVALRQAIEAPANPAMAAGSGVDVAGGGVRVDHTTPPIAPPPPPHPPPPPKPHVYPRLLLNTQNHR